MARFGFLACVLGSLFSVTFLITSCSSSGNEEKGPKNCVETLPDCDQGPVCVGRFVRTCSEDGKSYQYQYCAGQTCRDGACLPVACLEPGKTECTSQDTFEKCLEDMTQVTKLQCTEGNVCIAGTCVPQQCQPGQKECGWKAVLTCKEDGSGWEVKQCEENQYCDPDAKVCVDMDPFCKDNPLGAYCLDPKTAVQCDLLGKGVAKSCGKDEVCVDGFCQPRVCGVSYEWEKDVSDVQEVTADTIEDVTDTSIGEVIIPEIKIDNLPPPDAPKPQPKAKAWVTIDGGQFDHEKIEFTNNKKANYVAKNKDLQINMATGGGMVLEIHVANIEEGVVGLFSSDEEGSANAWIWFNDGTTSQSEVQWKYQSTTYEIVIEEFGPPGGRVKGTFEGVLQDETGGPSITLTDGYFDVPRVQ